MLEEEHASAEREAAAAFSRARIARRAEQYAYGATQPRSLLDLFLKILD
jgi:hypothetical protein